MENQDRMLYDKRAKAVEIRHGNSDFQRQLVARGKRFEINFTRKSAYRQ